MITTRLLPLDEYPLAAGFLDQFWAKNHIYARDRRLFDWTFHRPGFYDCETYSFAVAEDGGQVGGVLGGIPFVFNNHGDSGRGFWLANWKVRPEYRRGTTALDLLNHFHTPGDVVTISFGINATVAKLYDAMRWHVMEDAPRYFVALPDAVDALVRLLLLANESWSEQRCTDLARSLTAPRVAAPPPASFAPPDWKAWDRFTWAELKLQLVGAARDAAYLKWRYCDHPSFAYRFISVSEAQETGLVVWRLETIRRQHEGRLEEVGKLGRLVEFLPTSAQNARHLTAHLLLALREAGAFGADRYLYHGPFGQWLQRGGFHRLDTHPDGAGIPSRFQPLDASGGRIMSAVSLREPPLPQYPYDAQCPWYWTKSDSDQDRPN